jgi:predicted RNA-binding protein
LVLVLPDPPGRGSGLRGLFSCFSKLYTEPITESYHDEELQMCESNAYLIKDGDEELLMESVSLVKPQGDSVLLRSLFGEEATIKAKLREMDLTGHRIVLEAG